MSFILIIMIEIQSREIPSRDLVTVGEIRSSPLFCFGYYHKPNASPTSLSCNEQSEYDISFLCISITYY